MLCQNCKINESTIHLYTNVNGNKQQIDLCQNCYQIMKTDPNNSLFRGLAQAKELTLLMISLTASVISNNRKNQIQISHQLNLEEATVAVAMVAIPIMEAEHANRLRKSQKVS